MALPELREAEAPPDIAALYAALRQASGVPLVNLIHRHLATLPGVLPWLWEAIRPPLEDGTLAAARERLVAALPAPPASLSAAAWAAACLAPDSRRPVGDLIAVYNRGNLTNLILLTALRRALEAAPREDIAPPAPIPPPAMLPAPPPLPRLESLPPPVAALVKGLAARHGDSGVVPSLYLHLAHWPALLAALPGWLGEELSPTRLTAGRDLAIRLAEREADALRPRLAPQGGVPGGHGAQVLAALGTFTRQVIPGMVPLGHLLAGLLAPPADRAA
ncbi:hypothetical protein JYK14_00090 [Siccirubricoccus sp. KC 17139]|uniref:Uncharacterized protein n=1 Tax=Siccirubricoccus soli TaxID=2899147 RepID=A0ABT1CZX8_9PROT|nr:hypothetical protein [Siccirubricoccus soli]MCO6414580.1 hypothetical protein [Siccirubricoccus soli]MCP2680710.1 hypothetical protein [Siccirubricoccus soli]